MTSATVRISQRAQRTLRDLSEQEQRPMQSILDLAIEEYRRRRVLEESNAAYAKLRADPQEWAGVEEERAEWDVTLLDGIEPEEAPQGRTVRVTRGRSGRKRG